VPVTDTDTITVTDTDNVTDTNRVNRVREPDSDTDNVTDTDSVTVTDTDTDTVFTLTAAGARNNALVATAIPRTRFHGRFYGLRNFCCKTLQFCATRRESETTETPSVSNVAQRCESVRKKPLLNYKLQRKPVSI
jgi:hypothetical protein